MIDIEKIKYVPIVGPINKKVNQIAENIASAYNTSNSLENFDFENDLGFNLILDEQIKNLPKRFCKKENVLFISYNNETKFVVPSIYISETTQNKYFKDKDILKEVYENQEFLLKKQIKKGKILEQTNVNDFDPKNIDTLKEAFFNNTTHETINESIISNIRKWVKNEKTTDSIALPSNLFKENGNVIVGHIADYVTSNIKKERNKNNSIKERYINYFGNEDFEPNEMYKVFETSFENAGNTQKITELSKKLLKIVQKKETYGKDLQLEIFNDVITAIGEITTLNNTHSAKMTKEDKEVIRAAIAKGLEEIKTDNEVKEFNAKGNLGTKIFTWFKSASFKYIKNIKAIGFGYVWLAAMSTLLKGMIGMLVNIPNMLLAIIKFPIVTSCWAILTSAQYVSMAAQWAYFKIMIGKLSSEEKIMVLENDDIAKFTKYKKDWNIYFNNLTKGEDDLTELSKQRPKIEDYDFNDPDVVERLAEISDELREIDIEFTYAQESLEESVDMLNDVVSKILFDDPIGQLIIEILQELASLVNFQGVEFNSLLFACLAWLGWHFFDLLKHSLTVFFQIIKDIELVIKEEKFLENQALDKLLKNKQGYKDIEKIVKSLAKSKTKIKGNIPTAVNLLKTIIEGDDGLSAEIIKNKNLVYIFDANIEVINRIKDKSQDENQDENQDESQDENVFNSNIIKKLKDLNKIIKNKLSLETESTEELNVIVANVDSFI